MGPKARVTYGRITAKRVTYARITAKTACQLVKGEISYAEVVATEIKLDANPINQYFSGDQINLTEAISFDQEKVALDSFGLSDTEVLEVVKGISESVGLTESVDILLIIKRDFTDSVAISDVSVIKLDKETNENLIFNDSFNYEIYYGYNSVLNTSPLNTYTL